MDDLERLAYEVYDNIDYDNIWWDFEESELEQYLDKDEITQLNEEEIQELVKTINKMLVDGRKSEYDTILEEFDEELSGAIGDIINNGPESFEHLPHRYIGRLLIEKGLHYLYDDEEEY